MLRLALTTASLAVTALACRPVASPSTPAGPTTAADPSPSPKESPADAPPDPAAPVAEASAEPDAPAEPVAETGAEDLTGPLRFSPVKAGDGLLPADVMGQLGSGGGTMMDHPYDFGWSADGSHFGWCLVNGGVGCDDCHLVEVQTGAERVWTQGSECERGKDKRKKIAAVWAEHGIGKQPIPTQWPYGRDFAVAWRLWPGEQSEDGTVKRLSKLRLGAHFDGERRVFFRSITEPELGDYFADYDIFPAAIIPSPDGSKLAVLSHAFAGEYSDTIRLTVEDSAHFAFDAYHRSGQQFLKNRDPAAASRLELATRLEPDAWRAFHDLAAAYAQTDRLDDAKDALTRSIALGGAKAIKKAKRDENLAEAREQPWFEALLAPAPK